MAPDSSEKVLYADETYNLYFNIANVNEDTASSRIKLLAGAARSERNKLQL